MSFIRDNGVKDLGSYRLGCVTSSLTLCPRVATSIASLQGHDGCSADCCNSCLGQGMAAQRHRSIVLTRTCFGSFRHQVGTVGPRVFDSLGVTPTRTLLVAPKPWPPLPCPNTLGDSASRCRQGGADPRVCTGLALAAFVSKLGQ